ncbi:MAG: hypothetical protein ACRDY1_11080, partial [Acidimicrobiales bacterium]
MPPDSQANTLALITGMSCPSVGACVADGYYWVNFGEGDESGMLLTQAGSAWTVTSAGIPATLGRARWAGHPDRAPGPAND